MMTQEQLRRRIEAQHRFFRYNEIYAFLGALVMVGNMAFGPHATLVSSGCAALLLVGFAAFAGYWRQRTTRQ